MLISKRGNVPLWQDPIKSYGRKHFSEKKHFKSLKKNFGHNFFKELVT
jgi:hypothetical protein